MRPAIGLVLDGREPRAALVDALGGVIAEVASGMASSCLAELLQVARERGAEPRGVGVALPDADTAAPCDRLPEIRALPIHRGSVIEALTRGEVAFGAGRTCRDLLVLHVGEQVDIGLVLDGALRSTPSGGAGHISVDRTAHWRCSCGLPGCLHAALRLAAQDMISPPLALPADLTPAPNVTCAWLALGAVHLVNILNPGALVLSGALFDATPAARGWVAAVVEAVALAPARAGLRSISAPLGGRPAALLAGAAALVPPAAGDGDETSTTTSER